MINALLAASAKTYLIVGIVLFLLMFVIPFLGIRVSIQAARVGLAIPAIFWYLTYLVFFASLASIALGVMRVGSRLGWWKGLGSGAAASNSSHEADPVRLSDRDAKSMKIAAMVVGILGSVVTFFVSILALLVSSIFSAFTGEGIFVAIGWLVVLSSIGALVGAILTNGNPRLGAILLGIAAVPSIFFTTSGVHLVFGLGALLLVIAAVLAFIASAQESAEAA